MEKNGKDGTDYKDYAICIESIRSIRDRYFILNFIVWKFKIKKPNQMTVSECFVIRTKKNEEEIGEYYKRSGLLVTSISECNRTRDQELEII